MWLEGQTRQIERFMEQGYDCLKQNQQQQALVYFNNVVLLDSRCIDALKQCAELLMGLNRPMEASVYSHHAVQINPASHTLSLHAQVLYQMGHYSEALNCFERILTEEPHNYTVMGQRALCLTQINRYEDALQAYQNALAGSGNQEVWIHYNYSLCLLALGNLAQGFAHYEYRWLSALREKRQAWRVPDFVSREALQGKSILIHSEQGLGDSIQFFRYIPLLVQLGARVYLEMQPSLIPLFDAWRHSIQFIAIGSPLPTCDYCCPVMSLARLFQTELHNIPCPIPYVFPNLHTRETCQTKLGHSGRGRIGIAWRGSSANPMNQKRSLTLQALLCIHQPNLDFICLQKDVYVEEKNVLDQHHIPYHGLELSTMVGTAALISCLDLVITVDTSIAHLAAAMGKKVWILLAFNADWRWFLQRDDSPWYPSATLYRQEKMDDWDTPLTRIKNALQTRSPIEHQFNVDDLIQRAQQYVQQGLLTEAGQLYRHLLINTPGCHGAAQGAALIALQEHNLADAIQLMQRAAELVPTQMVYRRNLGELLCRAGQLDAAIASHQLAIRLEPDQAENHFLLALAYNNNNQFDLAIQQYRIALSYDQHHGFAWNNLGASLESMGDKEQAKAAYAAAIRLNPKHAEAQNNLGAIYSEEGQIDEAATHFEAAILGRPDFIQAHYNLSVVKTYTVNDPHLAFLETIGQNIEQYSISERIHYYFALGKALDDMQQYDRAFRAYAEGNRLHALQKPWNKTTLQNFVHQLTEVFTPSFLRPPKATPETRCPIFIVGMPRAGTTLIEQILCSHEQIYGAGELSILDELIQEACQAANLPFMTWVAQLNDHDFIGLGEQYLDRTWKLAPNQDFIIDKMPSNCFYIGLIYRIFPNAKIIHAMRDPMDSCFSCFTHLFKSSMLFAYDLTTLGEYYLLYAQAMKYWHNVLPTTFIFDAPYEQMVADHESMSKQLIDYIGLAWDSNCLNFYKNERVVKTASLTQVRKPIYNTSVKRWQHFAADLKPLQDILNPAYPSEVKEYLSKGSVLLEMGEISQAEEHFLKITAEHPIDAQVLAHYSLVQLRQVNSDNVSLHHLLSIVKDTIQTVSADKVEYAYFALGKCYEDLGEWAKSFAYFSLGCQIKRARITYDSAKEIQCTKKFIQSFTAQSIDALRAFANPSAVPIFIVGMPRSGTTLVEQIVSSHSSVHGAGELMHLTHLIQQPINGVHYPENMHQVSAEVAHAITENYLSYVQSLAPNATRITDKMPQNFMAIGLIHALLPNAKIIHVQRNPLDTCLSSFTKLFTQGQLYSYDLTELGHYYQCYEQTMNHWRSILPSDAWLDVQYEKLVNHLDEEAKRLIAFCDLPWESACLTFYQSKRPVRTASFLQVRQPIYTSSLERWRRYEDELVPLFNALNGLQFFAQQQA